ncbi:MAG: T9SS type A sorting domain-containing protein [Phaeodactylibacter sp.]|nr:T9SS type A sorting domain-containing protein [Phaeodactylibacter sp.]
MKKDYLSWLNINHFLTNLFSTLALLCLTAIGVQAQVDATVVVTAPAGIAGDYDARQAGTPGLSMAISGPVALAVDTSGATVTGCGSVTVDLTGSIALIDRGVCGFAEKVINAANAGAIGAIVCNNRPEVPNNAIAMATDGATIPAVMIGYGDCQTIRAEIGNGLMITLSPDGRPATAGETCDEAIEISAGTTTVDAVDSGLGAVFSNGGNARWYSYTPSTNSVVTVSSCNLTTVDTRLYILGGADCGANLVGLYLNDDCGDTNLASELSFLAEAGTRYFIYWDSRWEEGGFDFEVSEGPLPAIDVTFTVDMTNETVSPDGVKMVWAFSDAAGIDDVSVVDLTDNGDNTWSGAVSLTSFDTIGYAFMNGMLDPVNIEAVPNDCGLDSGFGFNIRPLIAASGTDFSVDPVCFGTCQGFCPSDVISCTDPDVIFCDEFEGGTDNWVLEGAWGLTNTQSFSPDSSLTDSPGGNYLADQNISATMATGLDLSSYLDATLAFRAIYDIEGGNFDYCFVEVSTNGGTSWVEVARFLGEGNLSPWIQYIYSLGGFVGNDDVRVRFRFFSDGGYEVDGIYIDDVIVTASTEDNSAPLILHTPPEYYESQLGDVMQTAEIVDISGLATAEVVYSVDGVAAGSVAGTDMGNNQWEFVIPEQEPGAQVDYYVHAVDASTNSNEAVSPTFSYIAGNHIFYDDGSVDFVNDLGPLATTAEQAAAVRVTIEGSTTIAYALVRNYTDTNRPNDSIDVHVWAPGPDGLPGEDLIDPIRVAPEATLADNSPMTRVDLRPYAAELTGLYGDVYVGFSVPEGTVWTVQTTPAVANRTYQQIGGNWNLYASDYHFRLVTGPVEEFTCADPAILIDDDIESLALGDAAGQTAWWGAWPGGAVGGEVTTEQAESGTQSLKMVEGANQDPLLIFGDLTSGHYVIRWDMYIPDGSDAYFNVQHLAPTSTAGFWGLECFFDTGVGRLELYDGSPNHAFDFPFDTWFPVYLFVDLDNDLARLIVDEHYVDQWQFSTGADAASMVNQLNSINFYPSAGDLFYVDNANFWRIPRADEGKYCYTATPITPGNHTVDGADCYGGGYHLSGGGLSSVWYSYTPSESGVITVGSCGGDSDSRVWIFSGDCDNLTVVGMNDDRCEQSNGDPYASYKEAYVEAGTTYYIMWDDRWDNASFKWDLTFSSDAPTEAAFCQSAVPVEPNVDIFVDAFVGEAGMAGDDLFDLCSSSASCPGGYTGSNWYSFTPEGDGTVTLTSCDSGTDTYVFVYTGTCGDYNSLELIASSEDDCGLSSLIEGWVVTGGVTYYIEWIDDRSADPFIWRLDFALGVDETALSQGVKVFPNPANELLNVRVDLPEAADNLAIRMVNTIGQVVTERYYGAMQTGNIEIDVTNIPAGMYLIQIMDGNAQYTQSVIVE